MALSDGEDFVTGDILSYQEANRLKNNFRGATAPTIPSTGMLFSDSDDDKLYHHGADSLGWDEVLQAARSADVTPVFDNLVLDVDASNVADPPSDAQLDALWPTHPNGFIGIVHDTTSAGSVWLCIYDSGWWYIEMALAV